MFESDLCNGYLLGFLTAGLLGFIIQRIRLLSFRASQANKKVAVVETMLSPREVNRASMKAQMEMAFWFILLIILVAGVVWVYLS